MLGTCPLKVSLIIRLKLEGVDSAALNGPAPVRAALLLCLLVPEIFSSHLHLTERSG